MSAGMLRDVLFTFILAGIFSAAQVDAAPPRGSCWPLPRWLGVACGCCPDDYCMKPLPPVECSPAQCCPDTYCPQPLPGVPCLNCDRSCDCYDIKPLPPVPRCSEPWYKGMTKSE